VEEKVCVCVCCESLKEGSAPPYPLWKDASYNNSKDVLGDLFFFWQSMEALAPLIYCNIPIFFVASSHSQEDLAKFGYTPDMKEEKSKNPFVFGYLVEPVCINRLLILKFYFLKSSKFPIFLSKSYFLGQEMQKIPTPPHRKIFLQPNLGFE